MATKEELSDELNEMLDTDIEWDRLLEDDLRHLVEMVDDGTMMEPIMKQFAKKHGKQALESQVDDWYPGKVIGRII